MTLARELAARIVGTSFEDVSAQAMQYAKIGLLDTIAVGIAGAGDEASLIARRKSWARFCRRCPDLGNRQACRSS